MNTAEHKALAAEVVRDVLAEREENRAIAETIRQQLGGRALSIMTGAKDFSFGDRCLSFRLPGKPGFVRNGINAVKVQLTPADDYTVTFYRIRGVKLATVATVEGVYCDSLIETVEEATGLCLRVPRFARSA